MTWATSVSRLSEVKFPAEKFVQIHGFVSGSSRPVFSEEDKKGVRSDALVFEKISYSEHVACVDRLYCTCTIAPRMW